MIKKAVLAAVFLLALAIPKAGFCESDLIQSFSQSHQAGIRLGAWSNLGELPPRFVSYSNSSAILETNLSDANFYFEGFFGYRLNEQLMLELSLGISNRGSVTLTQSNTTNVGNVIIYPILLQSKFYLLSMTDLRFQPYVFAGGGMYYGRRSTQVSSSGYVFNNDTESETDFHYSFGGGFDWPLSRSLSADLNVKYMPITFSKSFVAINDYRGVGITLGIKYLYSFKKEDKGKKERMR